MLRGYDYKHTGTWEILMEYLIGTGSWVKDIDSKGGVGYGKRARKAMRENWSQISFSTNVC